MADLTLSIEAAAHCGCWPCSKTFIRDCECSKPSIYNNSGKVKMPSASITGVTLIGCFLMEQTFPVADGSLITGRERREKLANYTPALVKCTFLAGKAVHFRDSSHRTKASHFSQPQCKDRQLEQKWWGWWTNHRAKLFGLPCAGTQFRRSQWPIFKLMHSFHPLQR